MTISAEPVDMQKWTLLIKILDAFFSLVVYAYLHYFISDIFYFYMKTYFNVQFFNGLLLVKRYYYFLVLCQF